MYAVCVSSQIYPKVKFKGCDLDLISARKGEDILTRIFFKLSMDNYYVSALAGM